MSESATPKTYVVERWWHRLLRVVGYILILIVFVIALAINLEDADYYTYSYSFDPAFKNSHGEEYECHSYESLSSFSCGEFTEGEAFMAHLLKFKGAQSKDGQTLFVLHGKDIADGISDNDMAVYLISTEKYKYRRLNHWDSKKVLLSFLWSALASFVAFLVLLISYKTILFIAHGHTRVVRN